MNYQDSSSDDIPYLPPDQYISYEQERNNHLSLTPTSNQEQRRGRSHFTEDEIRELDSPSTFVEIPINDTNLPITPRDPTTASIPAPPFVSDAPRGTSNHVNHPNDNLFGISAAPMGNGTAHSTIPHPPQRFKISWGRRVLGLFLIAIPAVFFSVAAHFIDWSMADFQLFSASFFIFQGIFWPSFGKLLSNLFWVSKKPRNKANSASIQSQNAGDDKSNAQKWILFAWTMVHSNFAAVAMILQLLSIQKLNISISLALSFGFDVVVILIRYILEKRACSPELIILSIISYVGYGVSAIPAFIADDDDTRHAIAIGVGASVGVMLLSIPSSLVLAKLRQEHVPESALGTSFAFFGCIHSLLTKEIMGNSFNFHLDGRAVGWAAGLISVVFLGTIFLFLETKLSSLIWQRDDDRPREFSSITRTRIAVFILSCLWELCRQGFRETFPEIFDVFGGFLVMLSFLLASGFQAWSKSCQNELYDASDSTTASSPTNQKFCTFIPWLFAQKSFRRAENEK